MDILEPPEVAERDIGAAGALRGTCQTGRTKARIGQKRFHVPVLSEHLGLGVPGVVFLRYVLVHSGERQPSGCLTPHIHVADVRPEGLAAVVDPSRPEFGRWDAVADDVDGQKKVAVGELPEISPHARDLAGGTGEEDASTGPDRIANAPVRLFPDGALHVFGAHGVIEAGFVFDEHMADSAASLIESRAADDTAIGKHLSSKEPEHAAG